MGKNMVFVCDHLYGGGSERVFSMIANKYCEFGNTVTIIVLNDGKRNPLNEKITVVDLSVFHGHVSIMQGIREIVRKLAPEYVISFEYYVNIITLLACKGLSTKVIVSERNDPSRVGNAFPKRLLRNYTYRSAFKLVCQTQEAKDYFPISVRKKAVVIPNPINEDLPQPYMGKREHCIISFCRLHEQKNLPMLIDGFLEFKKIFTDYHLDIYGDGEEKEYLIQYIHEKQSEKCIHLYPATNNIHEIARTKAMFISTSDYEGLSNSMLEALAIGLPTVCTDCPCGGARMIIKDGENGRLIKVGDVQQLTKVMIEIASDEKLAQSYSNNSIKIRNLLSLDNIIKKWESITL